MAIVFDGLSQLSIVILPVLAREISKAKYAPDIGKCNILQIDAQSNTKCRGLINGLS